MKRDQIVGIVAAIVAAVSAALPWIKNVTVLYETNGKASLGAFEVPITFLISGASDTPGGSIPAVAVVVAVVALGLIVWTFLPRTPRRVLYIVWGLVAIAAPVLLYLQLQSDIDAKASITTKTVFTYYGLGPFFLVGGGIIALVAGIIGAGKRAEPLGEARPAYATQDPYGGPAQAQPAGPYGVGAGATQSWSPSPAPYVSGQAPGAAPQQTAAEWQAGQEWGVPQQPQPPQPQAWGQPPVQSYQPPAPEPQPQQPWDQPPAPPTESWGQPGAGSRGVDSPSPPPQPHQGS